MDFISVAFLDVAAPILGEVKSLDANRLAVRRFGNGRSKHFLWVVKRGIVCAIESSAFHRVDLYIGKIATLGEFKEIGNRVNDGGVFFQLCALRAAGLHRLSDGFKHVNQVTRIRSGFVETGVYLRTA